jgi:hypothetical protein
MAERLSDRRAMAEQDVAEARRKVEFQSKLVATYERRHINSSDARTRLAQLERKLTEFEKTLADLTEAEGT